MQAACKKVAQKIGKYRPLSLFSVQELSLLVNGFSKWPEDPAMKEICQAVAKKIVQHRSLRKFDSQALALLVNGFSRWSEDPIMEDACAAIAQAIVQHRSLEKFNAQDLANLFNGFSKWFEAPAMQSACKKIAHTIHSQPFLVTTSQAFAQLVATLTKLIIDQSNVHIHVEEDTNLFLSTLDHLAQQIKSNPYLLQASDSLSVGHLLQAACRLASLDYERLTLHANSIIPLLVTRLKRLLANKTCIDQINLETCGLLSIGLYRVGKLLHDQRINDACTKCARHGTYFEGVSPLSRLASRRISETQGLNREK